MKIAVEGLKNDENMCVCSILTPNIVVCSWGADCRTREIRFSRVDRLQLRLGKFNGRFLGGLPGNLNGLFCFFQPGYVAVR